jgi:polyphosphate kinase
VDFPFTESPFGWNLALIDWLAKNRFNWYHPAPNAYGEPVVYLASADLMERNLDRRVEALCPVLDPDIARFIRHTVLDAYLTDTERATELRSDGTYRAPASGQVRVDAQPRVVTSSR